MAIARSNVVRIFKVLQPEDSDEQIDKHDGGRQYVDKEQRHREPGTSGTTCNIRVVPVYSTVAAAVIDVAYSNKQT